MSTMPTMSGWSRCAVLGVYPHLPPQYSPLNHSIIGHLTPGPFGRLTSRPYDADQFHHRALYFGVFGENRCLSTPAAHTRKALADILCCTLYHRAFMPDVRLSAKEIARGRLWKTPKLYMRTGISILFEYRCESVYKPHKIIFGLLSL
jgi:hypothetical protein